MVPCRPPKSSHALRYGTDHTRPPSRGLSALAAPEPHLSTRRL